jgi:NAD(P)-dependent dehydrogenase (short-subunit alcohol dehydrogenase family)
MARCLILGGNSGIGEATAKLIDGNGPVVYRPKHTELDVTQPGHVRRYIAIHGPFQYIVYSAGVNHLQWIKDCSSDEYQNARHTMDVNVGGFIAVASEHINIWPNSYVSAVAVSSDAAERPMRGSLAYCTSKAALDMAIRCMARELAPLWRVNGVAPGMVEGTAMTKYIDETIPKFRGWSPEYAREYERTSVPTGRRATLEEVAETIQWILLGPEQMTGTIIKINGGRS